AQVQPCEPLPCAPNRTKSRCAPRSPPSPATRRNHEKLCGGLSSRPQQDLQLGQTAARSIAGGTPCSCAQADLPTIVNCAGASVPASSPSKWRSAETE